MKVWSNVKVCGGNGGYIAHKFIASMITFVEALVFQEKTLPTPPVIAKILNIIEPGSYFNDMLGDWDIYNGHDCVKRSDHAKWHETAAHGLLHFTDVADALLGFTKKSC